MPEGWERSPRLLPGGDEAVNKVGEIPPGYKRKWAGKLAAGDKVWMPKWEQFREPSETITFSNKVRDYICVIEQRESEGRDGSDGKKQRDWSTAR